MGGFLPFMDLAVRFAVADFFLAGIRGIISYVPQPPLQAPVARMRAGLRQDFSMLGSGCGLDKAKRTRVRAEAIHLRTAGMRNINRNASTSP